MARTVAIHQPEYFPWLGFLHKARSVDAFVLLDTVQFDRSSLQHRARVVGPNGVVWLTMPFVHKFPQRIDEVELADARWPTKHWKTLQACYGRGAGFREAAARLEAFFAVPRARLVDVTVASVELLLAAFDVRTPVVRASNLKAQGEKSELVLAICRELEATRYVSGRTGAEYLDQASFAAAGIDLVVQRFTAPSYERLRAPPESEDRGISALDAWLNLGAAAPGLIARGDSA